MNSMDGSTGPPAPARDQADTSLETKAASSVDRPAHALTGRMAGAYRIDAWIGAGGMGEVYRAHDTKLDRPVALKLLPPQVTDDPERLRRFHSEARAASSLNHPNILVIHDFGDLESRPFIVSELVDGETLRQRLDHGAVPVREAVGMAIQIASALAAAHARGLVHRDIKPENVMVRTDGYVKVLDFGLAKLMDASPGAAMAFHTQPGIVIGTPHYMSPEQAEGKNIDERSDIFSLDVMLYELGVCSRPVAGDSSRGVLSSSMRDTPRPSTEVSPALPPDLQRLVSRCLAKDRQRRYQSAGDLRRDLDELEQSLRSGQLGVPNVTAPRARAEESKPA